MSLDMPTDATGRVLVFAAGIAGAAGVALSAAAAHLGGAFTGTAASFLLAHAPALLAAGLAGASRTLRAGALVLLLGLVLFSGDLLARDFLGSRLFAFAAPAGGTLLIAGWVAIAVSAFAGPQRRP
ncbi:DUF423 domain-containing protein [Mesorhizobium sp. PUT5]|uniref:DUF423 domain-containing protein n=1 Tax=Mesorhizobium sp. PUT5 TaxID=3454629 RepID=UPI003FA4432E